jgi:hypothetical protein
MVSGPGLNVLCDSGAFPCDFCRTIPSSAHNADCTYIRNVAMSVGDLSSIQTTSDQGAVARLDPLIADQSWK